MRTPFIHVVFLAVSSCVFLALTSPATEKESVNVKEKNLSSQEKKVICDKGTEPPFSGKFIYNKAKGTYVCKRCGSLLFDSSAKFDSKSGWPSFDDALPGAVRSISDEDGIRTEIVCAHCGAHLGHVFKGEGFTDKNTRYCVNSISLDFEPAAVKTVEKAIFAGGCFWGVEHYMRRAPGVISTRVGYIGGHVDHPTYEQVCRTNTGHAEAVEVAYDPSKTTFEALAKLFFEIHDPTQEDGQGPDIGEQYRSAVFPQNEEQRKIALKLIEQLKKKGLDVKTRIENTGAFWPAEDYHQDYYEKKGATPYCHVRTKRF